ncbi:hypothetical protein [Halomarina pelagica]|uniref:hypothetical protein n=1 Tax=Halomarina pelagica TaxID=2961599 RepID=UPI0020C3C0D4|nr:hypothetical protein [Halomarina sp. BND7]
MARWEEYEVSMTELRLQSFNRPEPIFMHPRLAPRIDRIDDLYKQYDALDNSFSDEAADLIRTLQDELRLLFVVANAAFKHNCGCIVYWELFRPELCTKELLDQITSTPRPETLESMLYQSGVLGGNIVGDMKKIRGTRHGFAHDMSVNLDWDGELREMAVLAMHIIDILYSFEPRQRIDDSDFSWTNPDSW